MKKAIIRLTAFNAAILVIVVACFSKRLIGLSFDVTNPLKFALSLGIAALGLGIFAFGNFKILTQKTEIKFIKNSDDIESWIKTLKDCIQTDPLFKKELEEAIKQLETLKRKDANFAELLRQNNLSEVCGYLEDTKLKVKLCVTANAKRIANRLLVLDAEDCQNDDISEHMSYVKRCLAENNTVLDEYQRVMLNVSQMGDQPTTGQIAEVQRMNKALNTVLSSSTALLEENNNN